MQSRLIPTPDFPIDCERRYRLSPRKKRAFHTILDASQIIDPSDERNSLVTITSDASTITMSFAHPIIGGQIKEKLVLGKDGDGLKMTSLERNVFTADDRQVRSELVDFTDPTLPLPPETYPEVAVPFMAAWFPLDGKLRDVYAWINDRFVARIQFKSLGKKTVKLPGGSQPAIEMLMFPDINDWIHLGKVITRMIRPFVPKYRVWFAPEPPFHVLRFEGPYGPPGAPEIVLELL